MVVEDRLKILLELRPRLNRPTLLLEYAEAVIAHRRELQRELRKEGGNSGRTFTEVNTIARRLSDAGAHKEDITRVTTFISQEDSAGRFDLDEVRKILLEGK
ncbi:MAG: hypothetical protein Q8Q38_00190 [bacterium]|nr:hypothetical protein [bacterium]MDZ4231996.1 hypothetical protein [Candidatus Pacearchaeota archaeon]